MFAALSIILKIIFIVFFFGFCVFIHEFGHLLVAAWRGLHIEKFSVGMGPRLWGFKYKGIDFIISALPFGGYVSLPQLDPTDAPKSSAGQPLPHASPSARALTALAGPLFNVLFGFLLATIMWAAGLWRNAPSTSMVISRVPPFLAQLPAESPIKGDTVITAVDGVPMDSQPAATWGELGYLLPQALGDGQATAPETLKLRYLAANGEEKEAVITPAPNPEWQAGLRRGDRIVAINGRGFSRGVDEFRQEYLLNDQARITLTVIRDGVRREVSFEPASNPMTEGLGYPFFLFAPPMTIGMVIEGTAAAQAGLKANDQLLSINGRNLPGASELPHLLRDHAGQTVTVEVCRGGRQITLPGLAIPAAAADADAWPGELVGICGSINAERVVAGSPARKAGMRDGDRILTIAYDGEPRRNIGDTRDFIEAISGGNGRPVTITGLRGKTPFSVTVQPELNRELDPPRYAIGVILGSGPGRILMHVDPWTQFTEVVGQTTRTLGLLFKPITTRVHGAVTGKQVEAPRNQVGLKHMSGPGGILMMLWFRLQSEGYRGGFAFIILITFSLAFMNLLPLPVLDGGHIVFAGIEALIHRRLPARAFTWLYNTFAILLIALMVYITFYDGKRFIKYNSRHDTPVKPAAPASPQPESPQPGGEGAASK